VSDALQIMWKTPKHVFVRRDNVVVQIRGEEHSVAALEAQDTGLRLARAQVPTGPLAALLVIEEGAPAPAGDVAKRQRELVASFSSDERVYICVVLEGSSASVSLKRTFARALFRGPRRHICGTVRDGARWLAAEIGADADDLVAFVESMRPR
jgi:hypothetical protein